MVISDITAHERLFTVDFLIYRRAQYRLRNNRSTLPTRRSESSATFVRSSTLLTRSTGYCFLLFVKESSAEKRPFTLWIPVCLRITSGGCARPELTLTLRQHVASW